MPAVQQLPTAIAQPALAALPPAAAQGLEQGAASALVRVDVAVDPFMTGQGGMPGNLRGTVVFGQKRFDLLDASSIDARAATGTRAAGARKVMRSLWLIALTCPVAPQFAADRAGAAVQPYGNGSHGMAGFGQCMYAISFVQVQAA